MSEWTKMYTVQFGLVPSLIL